MKIKYPLLRGDLFFLCTLFTEVIDSAEVGLRLQRGLEDPTEFESADSELEGSVEPMDPEVV